MKLDKNLTTVRIARGWLLLGALGLTFTAAFGIGHFVFGMPVHIGHADRLMTSRQVAGICAVMASGFGLFAALGAYSLLRRP